MFVSKNDQANTKKLYDFISSKSKTSIGVDWNSEYISITHFVTDEDGSLKIKLLEEFKDSKSELEFMQAALAASKKLKDSLSITEFETELLPSLRSGIN